MLWRFSWRHPRKLPGSERGRQNPRYCLEHFTDCASLHRCCKCLQHAGPSSTLCHGHSRAWMDSVWSRRWWLQPARVEAARSWLAPAAASMESVRHRASRAAHAADKNVLQPALQQTQHTAAGTKRWLQSLVSPRLLLRVPPTSSTKGTQDRQCSQQNLPSKVLPFVVSSPASLTCCATPGKTAAHKKMPIASVPGSSNKAAFCQEFSQLAEPCAKGSHNPVYT